VSPRRWRTDAVVHRPGLLQGEEGEVLDLRENMVEVRARVCVDCGYVDLYADTSKLKKLVTP